MRVTVILSYGMVCPVGCLRSGEGTLSTYGLESCASWNALLRPPKPGLEELPGTLATYWPDLLDKTLLYENDVPIRNEMQKHLDWALSGKTCRS